MTDLATPPIPPFGQLLKGFRKQQKLSQMQLALAVSSTPRHLSFVETGRSRPGRGLVLRIAKALGLTPRQSNTLLAAAGLPPAFAEQGLESAELAQYRDMIRLILDRHDPYPACALDRLGQVVMYNATFEKFSPQLIGKSAHEMLDDFLGNGPSRQMVRNWAEIAWNWVDRLRADFAQTADPDVGALLARAEALMAGIERPDVAPKDVLSIQLDLGGELIETFASVMRFETAQEVTLSELRIELIFPKNAAATALFASMAAEG